MYRGAQRLVRAVREVKTVWGEKLHDAFEWIWYCSLYRFASSVHAACAVDICASMEATSCCSSWIVERSEATSSFRKVRFLLRLGLGMDSL
ncbi:hypothetical protein M408DRAFT_249042 [Serendipita vermifera MAFF 305830]|uniref:Uncharacterized protein n=1 Tax=Serendipita vermifera MAFF 305830 TaxID=933852 RepID=A0A0C3AV75_SERVB|nr:hypothetical protein M408DRAFT_249042 [Serendipita vermifera MAFF 305830]